jgi:1-deoxy-D-xylulose-5-phosphate synthase
MSWFGGKDGLLKNINSPHELKGLSVDELEVLARELRQKIIETVAKTGGHLAPSLGVVELTIALHYVFNAPRDKIIWDVGHQAYAHKLITGRRDQFHTLRTYGGISGFPKRSEGPYDTFDTGHSSTSISAGLGISTAKALQGEKDKVIAVIGDGSMTAGMAFEGLNQAGETERNLIVVLNDNAMSISPNVGAFSSFLSRKMTGRRFVGLKRDLEIFIRSFPGVGENILNIIRKSEDSFITFFTPGMLFEAFKFQYMGPIKGHKLPELIEAFTNAKNLHGPVLVHVLTVKGKGYGPAEKDPAHFHGVGSFEIPTGSPLKPKPKPPPTYTDVFGKTMVELGRKNKKLFAITAAMPEGTGLSGFAEAYPDRFLDVGIAEQHAVTFAAGLATEGFRPVVAIYSTFLQRAFDQIVHDVCLQNLPVVFAIDRGGLVGEDGPTHHGQFDITYLRSLPNITLMAPKDENELRHMIYTAIEHTGPVAIRYPRGNGLGVPCDPELKVIAIGESEVIKEGEEMVIIALGNCVAPSLEAAVGLENEGHSVAVINCRFVKPLDKRLAETARKVGRVLIVEENIRQGGLGGAFLELLNDMGIENVRIKRIGLPDKFIEHGPAGLLRKNCGLDADGIMQKARELL